MEKKLRVIVENCPQNHSCPSVEICPVSALTQEGFQAPTVDAVNVRAFAPKRHWFWSRGCGYAKDIGSGRRGGKP